MKCCRQKKMSQSVASVIVSLRVRRVVAIAFAFVIASASYVRAQQPNGVETATPTTSPKTVHDERHEQWGLLEVSLPGPTSGNPFIDVQLTATFQQGNDRHVVNGFYDGEGIYRVRFMPDKTGRWQYNDAQQRRRAERQNGAI